MKKNGKTFSSVKNIHTEKNMINLYNFYHTPTQLCDLKQSFFLLFFPAQFVYF
jgi:hypothetical protein